MSGDSMKEKRFLDSPWNSGILYKVSNNKNIILHLIEQQMLLKNEKSSRKVKR